MRKKIVLFEVSTKLSEMSKVIYDVHGWARKRFSLTHISILIARLSFWKQAYILNMTFFCLANKQTHCRLSNLN